MIYSLLDTRTSSATLKTPDLMKLSSRYTKQTNTGNQLQIMFVNSLIYFNLLKSIIPLILCFGIHILFIFCFEIEMTIVIIPELAHQFLFKITKFVV